MTTIKREAELRNILKESGYRLPHGYEITKRKPRKKKKTTTTKTVAKKTTKKTTSKTKSTSRKKKMPKGKNTHFNRW